MKGLVYIISTFLILARMFGENVSADKIFTFYQKSHSKLINEINMFVPKQKLAVPTLTKSQTAVEST